MSDPQDDPVQGPGPHNGEPAKKLPAKAVKKSPARNPAKKVPPKAATKSAPKKAPGKAAPKKAPPKALEPPPAHAAVTAGATRPPLPAPATAAPPADRAGDTRQRLVIGLTAAVTLALLLRRLRRRSR